MSPTIDLTTAGPTEAEWQEACASLRSFAWPRCSRVVVVSPHPDDETFGAGGLIVAARSRGLAVVVIVVTDGEAGGRARDLGATRTTETTAALHCLDPSGGIDRRRLKLPDGGVTKEMYALTTELGGHFRRDDLVVCPLPDDGHPDHRATALAATAAAECCGAAIRWFPIWAWHCHEPIESPVVGGERLTLDDEALARKRAAAGCYRSQIDGDEPVVPASMLIRLLRPFEVFVRPR